MCVCEYLCIDFFSFLFWYVYYAYVRVFFYAIRHAFSAFARGLSIGELVKAWTSADGGKQGLDHHRTISQKSSTQLHKWPTCLVSSDSHERLIPPDVREVHYGY